MEIKPIATLDFSDLSSKSVWEYWIEDKIEYAKASAEIEISENDNTVFLVLTEFKLNNGQLFYGFCSPQDSSGLDYLQPVLFTKNGQFKFWCDKGFTNEEKLKMLAKIDLGFDDIFPVIYTTKVKCDGKYFTGKVKGFNN